jgi:hypothetical protein
LKSLLVRTGIQRQIGLRIESLHSRYM